MSLRLITFKEALNRVPLSKSHLYRLINLGEFPHPVRLGPHKIAFIEREVDEWIEGRANGRGLGVIKVASAPAVVSKTDGAKS